MSDDTYFKTLALGEVQILLPRSHGRSKPIKFSRRRPVPPHPDPESQRVDISKPPTSLESRASCCVCASTWGNAVRSERHTTSAARGQPRVVQERTSSLPSSTERAQAKLTVAITIAAGHARSATRADGDHKVANGNTATSECRWGPWGRGWFCHRVQPATADHEVRRKPLRRRLKALGALYRCLTWRDRRVGRRKKL